MKTKSIEMQIIDAIDSEDCDLINRLFKDNPEQKNVHTFMAGQTWLGYASQIGKIGSVTTLIDVGLDVNMGTNLDNYGPICTAAGNGRYEVVELLLVRGAKLDVSASVRNPLFAAIVGRSSRIVHLLLEAGIDSKVRYNSKTMKNMDAIAFALMRGEYECAQIIAEWNSEGDEESVNATLIEAQEIAKINGSMGSDSIETS